MNLQTGFQKEMIPKKITNFVIIGIIWGTAVFIYHFLDNSVLILPVAGLVCCVYLFSVIQPNQFRNWVKFIFQYRWICALLIFIFCVLCRLNGSSIGMYNEYLPTRISGDDSILFGKYRSIRSDEWGVQTPTFFSQQYNYFQLYSNQMSLSPTNMVVDYYSPVWDITIIGKPLAWGYLLFGNEAGLSWYWCGQLILLFMVSFELCRILTENSKFSVAGALMITLAPNIQWWFLPHMPIVILYAEILFVIGYYFFTAKEAYISWLLSGLSVIAAIGFGLSIFPSFQVPCFYIVAVLLAACLYRDRKRITFSGGQWLKIALPMVAVGLVLVHFYSSSQEAIEAVLNSVYPGKRMSTGGDRSLSDLFMDLSSLTLPYRDITYSNNCEVSSYVHFAPFFILLSPRMLLWLKRNGKSTVLGYALLFCVLGSAYYMIIGIPESLARITLLRYCNRMNGVYGWCATLFTIWGFSQILRYPTILNTYQKILYPILYAVIWLLILDENLINYLSSVFSFVNSGYILALIEIVLLLFVLFLAEGGHLKSVRAMIIAVMILCGATVNPVNRGVSAVTDHPLCKTTEEIASADPDSLWLNLTDAFPISNLLAANGAKTLSATNFYYDKEKWQILDPEGKYQEYTNRYCNQIVSLNTENSIENAVELLWPDLIRVSITPDMIPKLGVRYILTNVDYTDCFSQFGIDAEEIVSQDNYFLFRLDY